MSNFDIIDRIDALVDDQMAEGEPRQGYDFGDPTYPRCPHCSRHWHGLRLTQRIASMYATGRYDPDYSAAEDDSPILCEGSEFIGPQRAPVGWSTGRGAISIQILPDISGLDAQLYALQHRLTELMLGSGVAEAMRGLSASFRLFSSEWSQIGSWTLPEYTYPEPVQCTDDIVVEFGPQNWVYELTGYTPQAMQFPRPYAGYRLVSPLQRAVHDAWDELTAPSYPIPVSPGIDFDAIPVNAYAGTGQEPKTLGRRTRR